MRQSATILLALLTLLTTVGISVNKHYCGNRIHSIQIASVIDDETCCGKSEMPAGCCHNETEWLQLQEDLPHFQINTAFWPHLPVAMLLTVEIFTGRETGPFIPMQYLHFRPPPLPSLSITFCSFLL